MSAKIILLFATKKAGVILKIVNFDKRFLSCLLCCVFSLSMFTSCGKSASKQVEEYNHSIQEYRQQILETEKISSEYLDALVNFAVYYRYDERLKEVVSDNSFGFLSDDGIKDLSKDDVEYFAKVWNISGDTYEAYLTDKCAYSGYALDFSKIDELIQNGLVSVAFQSGTLVYDDIFSTIDSNYLTELVEIQGYGNEMMLSIYWSEGKVIGMQRRLSNGI